MWTFPIHPELTELKFSFLVTEAAEINGLHLSAQSPSVSFDIYTFRSALKQPPALPDYAETGDLRTRQSSSRRGGGGLA